MHLEPWHMELIERSRVARLATVSPAGTPALVPVCFALFEGRFAIPIDDKPKSGRPLARLRNLAAEPRCALLFDHYDDDWSQLAWLRVDGSASVIDGGMAPEMLAALRSRYSQYREMDLEHRSVIVMTPARCVSWRWQMD
jgi:PPOX class probable F420-dependent enzyme